MSGSLKGLEMTRASDEPLTEDYRLADFIRANIEPIVTEWISFARTRTPAGDSMNKLALKDHIVEILQFIAKDLESPQTKQEQVAKSKGLEPDGSPLTQTAAEIHAALRLADGFDIDQMVSEYRALRASVVKQWIAQNAVLAATDLEDLTRFNEAIDQAMTESVAHYTKMINRSRNLFIGILGHDLRNPIGAASMTAQKMVELGSPEARQTKLAAQIVQATERGLHILDDLVDITRSAFGLEIPISRSSMDVGELVREIVDEMSALANGRSLKIAVTGETTGEWDKGRLGQVLSNLVGNAIQYSPPQSEVFLTVAGEGDHVSISIQNGGEPISPQKLSTLFEAMKRRHEPDTEGQSFHLGLGLFIAKRIIDSHGGTLLVTSDSAAGTIFTARLPRTSPPAFPR